MQLALVEKRLRPGPSERSLCGVGGCTNVRELSARGYEKGHCTRHRPLRVIGAAGAFRPSPRVALAARGACVVPGCVNVAALVNNGRRFYVRPFCTFHHRVLTAAEKRAIVPDLGVRKNAAGRLMTTGGYVRVMLAPGEWRLEHRLVMEGVLGRPLEGWEQVHHINGHTPDTRPENLQLRKPHGAGQAYCCADCGSSRVLPVPLA